MRNMVLGLVDGAPRGSRKKISQDRAVIVDQFCARIGELNEQDYGDWMRRVNSYWVDLDLVLADATPSIRTRLERMREMIQFTPEWSIDHTRRRVVELATEIENELSAQAEHRADAELEDYGISECEELNEYGSVND